jgi:hypothetical protein
MSTGSIASTKKNPYSVSVKTGGGNETSALGSSEISNNDLRAAIEKSVTRSSLFREVVQGKNGDYELRSRLRASRSPPSARPSLSTWRQAGRS